MNLQSPFDPRLCADAPPGLRLWRVQYYRRSSGARATMAVWAPTRHAAAYTCVEVAHRGRWGFESPVLAVDDITDRPGALQYGWAVRSSRITSPDCAAALPVPYSGDLS